MGAAGAARGAVRGRAAALLEVQDIRGDLHCHTTWSDGRFSVEAMGRAARDRGYDYIAICDHTPAVGAVQGLTGDDVRRQGEEIAAANERLAPFRVLRGIECDILPDGRLDLPDDVLAELDWVQASVHGGPADAARGADPPRGGGAAPPRRALPEPPEGPAIGRRPENALDLDRVFEVALEHDVAVEVNGLTPRLDLSGEHVREALRAGVKIVCSTDAHSTRGLENMPFAVHTARRGGATARGRPQHPPAGRAPPKMQADGYAVAASWLADQDVRSGVGSRPVRSSTAVETWSAQPSRADAPNDVRARRPRREVPRRSGPGRTRRRRGRRR